MAGTLVAEGRLGVWDGMQEPAEAQRWENLRKRVAMGDSKSARDAVAFARKALATPKGVVAYASSLTFGMSGQAAHGWYLRIGDTDQLADALRNALGSARTSSAWAAIAKAGMDLGAVQADAVARAAPIPDEVATGLHFPVTPPTVRLRTMQTAVAFTLEAVASTPGKGRESRPNASLRKQTAALAEEIRQAAKPGATPPNPELIAVRWRRHRARIGKLRDTIQLR